MDDSIKRGEVFYADLSPVVGSEQGGVRPVLIVQNDVGNQHSPTASCCWSRSAPSTSAVCAKKWGPWMNRSCGRWTRPFRSA